MTEKKRMAGRKAVDWVRNGMVLGLGTGSTTYYALERIGELCREGFDLRGIPTSSGTEELARKFGIPLTSLDEVSRIDLAIDGADEVDPQLRLIKGMGGALLREKIVASASKEVIIAVDDSKLVDALGTRSPLPVEVIRFGHRRTKEAIESLGCRAELRGKEAPFVTDTGNYIYDCSFGRIDGPEELEKALNLIPGVVENGLFIGLASKVVIATDKGATVRERRQD